MTGKFARFAGKYCRMAAKFIRGCCLCVRTLFYWRCKNADGTGDELMARTYRVDVVATTCEGCNDDGVNSINITGTVERTYYISSALSEALELGESSVNKIRSLYGFFFAGADSTVADPIDGGHYSGSTTCTGTATPITGTDIVVTLLRGGARSATLARTLTTVTVTLADHGLIIGNAFVVAGADQTEYNGEFTVAGVVDDDHFTYLIVGSPATPATGTITVGIPQVIAIGHGATVPIGFPGVATFISNVGEAVTRFCTDETVVTQENTCEEGYRTEAGTTYTLTPCPPCAVTCGAHPCALITKSGADAADYTHYAGDFPFVEFRQWDGAMNGAAPAGCMWVFGSDDAGVAPDPNPTLFVWYDGAEYQAILAIGAVGPDGQTGYMTPIFRTSEGSQLTCTDNKLTGTLTLKLIAAAMHDDTTGDDVTLEVTFGDCPEPSTCEDLDDICTADVDDDDGFPSSVHVAIIGSGGLTCDCNLPNTPTTLWDQIVPHEPNTRCYYHLTGVASTVEFEGVQLSSAEVQFYDDDNAMPGIIDPIGQCGWWMRIQCAGAAPGVFYGVKYDDPGTPLGVYDKFLGCSNWTQMDVT